VRLPFFRRRVRFIPQLEATECGAASLAMVLDYHGACLPLSEVREACAVSRDGVNANAIIRAAQSYGLVAQGFRVEPSDLGELALPAIIHWEMRHFVVLERIERRHFTIVDPALGRRVLSREEFSAAFTGVALAFEPSDRLVARARRSGSLARYRRVLFAQKMPLFMLLSSALAMEMLAVLLPAGNQVLIDHVIGAQHESWTLPLVVLVAAASLLMLALGFVRDRLVRRLGFVIDLELVSLFVEHLVRLPLGFFQQRTQGDLMDRVASQRQVRDVVMRAFTACLDGLLVCTYGALMIAYHAQLGLAVIGMTMLRVLWLFAVRPGIEQQVASELVLRGNELGVLVEAFAAPEALKACAIEDRMLTRYHARLVERLTAGQRREQSSGTLAHATSLFDVAAQALVLWLGGIAVIEHQLTLGAFASFVVLSRLFQRPVQAIVEATMQLMYVRVALARFDDVLATARERDGTERVHGLAREIVLDRVSFRYGPSSPWVCKDLSLTIKAGEKVAIVGRSGQGKSSILSLLLGLTRPTSGAIYVDGKDLSSVLRSSWLAQVGVVLQEPLLLDDSVAANLSFHLQEAPFSQVRRAAELACVDDVIAALPQGYDTRLGMGGSRLSGGQRQRLGLARALCREPALLLLDEATSALDAESEARVHRNLAQLGCTRVVVAHRLSTVRDADRILVFEGGQIVQSGSYDELARSPGLFASLAAS
jgi:ATP-binding cassette subfamily B protein